jgi:hypothetical protein
MSRSTGKLSAAPDDHSDVGLADKTKRSDPAVVSGRHRTDDGKGADMAKRTRGPSPSDSETRTSAVKITPASSISATVPTIRSVA